MLSVSEIVATLRELAVTHVVWVPDSSTGPWEAALDAEPGLTLIRVCREGEAWPLAAGLLLGGMRPLIVMQSTGLFESGDALRNVLFDLQLPLLAIVGYRSYLVEGSADSARRFTEPILNAWGLRYVLVRGTGELTTMADHFRDCQKRSEPGVALLAEGRM